MKTLLLFIITVISCKGQITQNKSNEDYYVKCHILIDDILQKDSGKFSMLRSYNFSSPDNLGESDLYDKMLNRFKLWKYDLTHLEISENEIFNLTQKTGWNTSHRNYSLEHWDESLFQKSKVQLIDKIIKYRFKKPEDPLYFKPFTINFKGNLALIEYRGYSGMELRALLYRENSWHTIAVGSEYEPSRE